ncbi:hypothetical protein JCM30760_27210 [Thiomicrorhabdus hydrogeniphila]
MIWEIYSYWNVQELRGVMEGAAMLTNSSDYTSLISTAFLFGLIAVAIGVMMGAKDALSGFKWFITAIFLYFILLVPKADVAIVDRTGTAAATTVHNVPLSLAVFGHVSSSIGDWLTISYETAMKVITPSYALDGIAFSGNGLLFGEKLLLKAENARSENIAFRMNMSAFFDKCVFPEFDTGNISITDVLQSKDMWSQLSNVNPSLYVQLYNDDGTPTPSPVACDVAYNTVLPAVINNASNEVISRLGGQLYPDESAAVANASLKSALAGSYTYYMNIADNATDIIKQQIMSNTFFDASTDEATATAVAMSETGAKMNYGVLHQVAQSAMPKLRNVIEVVIYAVFPIVVIMIILAGDKAGMALKSYFIAFIWIQLWAPLYAVMNYMISSYNAKEMIASVTSGAETSAWSSGVIKEQILASSDIAGMMAMAIPIIALAIAKGGEMAMTSFASNALRPLETNAGASSREVSQGNINMGNTSMDNTATNSHNANKFDTAPVVNNGASTRIDGSGHKYTTNDQGVTAHDSSLMENKGAFHNFSQAVAEKQSYSQSLDNSVKAAQKSSAMASFEQGSSFANAGLLSSAASGGKEWGNAFGNTYSNGTQQAFKTMDETAKSLEASGKVGQGQGAELMASMAGMVKAGVSLEAGALAEFKAGAGKKFSSQAIAEAAEAVKGIDKNDVSGAATIMSQTSENEQIQDKLGLNKEAKTTLQAGNERAEKFKRDEKAELEKAKGYQEKLDNAEERVNQSMIQLGAATPFSSMSEEQKRFATGEGSQLLGQASEARNRGDSKAADAYMAEFNQRAEHYSSQFGAPTASKAQKLPDNAKQQVLNQNDANIEGTLQTREDNKELVHADQFIEAVKDKKDNTTAQLNSEEQWVKDSHEFHTNATNAEATMVQDTIKGDRDGLNSNKQVQSLDNVGLNDKGVLESRNSETADVVLAGGNDLKNMANKVPGFSKIGNEIINKIEAIDDKADADPNHVSPGAGIAGTKAYIPGTPRNATDSGTIPNNGQQSQGSNQANLNPSNQGSNQANPNPSNQGSNQANPNPSNQGSNQANPNPSNQGSNQANPNPSNQGSNQANLNPSNQGSNQANPNPSNQGSNQANPNPSNQGSNQANLNPSNQGSNQANPNPSNQGSNQANLNPRTGIKK